MDHQTRRPADIRRDIADVERYLTEVPPHSGSASSLQDALARLRGELERAQAPSINPSA